MRGLFVVMDFGDNGRDRLKLEIETLNILTSRIMIYPAVNRAAVLGLPVYSKFYLKSGNARTDNNSLAVLSNSKMFQ